MRSSRHLAILASIALSGCATFSPSGDQPAIEALLAQRGAPDLGWDKNFDPRGDVDVQQLLNGPMDQDKAVRVAMVKSPRLQQIYGELGLARADVLEAVQVANPRIAVSSLADSALPGSQLVLGIAAPLIDLLTLPAKNRLARLDYERARYETAAAILGVSLDVESAWYRFVAAQQVAEMRSAVAEAFDTSAELAQRFYDAGNITELQLNREKAAASEARIEAAKAAVSARLARLELNNLLGLSGAQAYWTSAQVLPQPVQQEDDAAELQQLAQSNSLDLLAARKGLEVASGARRIARSFRLLGSTSVGYGREREVDHSLIRGPTLDLELPLFNQGGARVARAEGGLRLARARLAQVNLANGNAIVLGAERVRVMHDVVDIYRSALVPQREIVARESQLEQNYALIGEFEVLQARAQQYAAYQGFLEAVRDYWLARVELVRAVGQRLPSDLQARQPTLSPAEFLAQPAPSTEMDDPHAHHHGGSPAAAEPGIPASPADPGPASEHRHHGTMQ